MDAFVPVPLERAKQACMNYKNKEEHYRKVVVPALDLAAKKYTRCFTEIFIFSWSKKEAYLSQRPRKSTGCRLSEDGYLSKHTGAIWDNLNDNAHAYGIISKMLSVGCSPLYLSPSLAEFVSEFEK